MGTTKKYQADYHRYMIVLYMKLHSYIANNYRYLSVHYIEARSCNENLILLDIMQGLGLGMPHLFVNTL